MPIIIKNKVENNQLSPGNVIPHEWYKTITDKRGGADLVSITILSEVVALLRMKEINNSFFSEDVLSIQENTLQTSYHYFKDKFCISKETLRRSLLRLESKNILKRDIFNIEISDKTRCNRLFLTINNEFFEQCFRNPEFDIRATCDNSVNGSTNCGDLIRNKNKENKDRSIGSNFNFFGVSEFGDKKESNIVNRVFKKNKSLQDFFPISLDDCNKLQSSSGRKFSLNAMNEILKDLSNKLEDRTFYSKKGFMAYMSKVFKFEMRDAQQTANETFRINSNYSDSEQDIQKQEKFLNIVESDRGTDSESQLKRKLVGILSRDKAYLLLTNLRKLERVGGKLRIHLAKKIELSDLDKQLILDVGKTVFNRIGGNEIIAVEEAEYIYWKNNKYVDKNIGEKSKIKCESEYLASLRDDDVIKKLPLQQKFRKYFIENFWNKESGMLIDKNWLSSLKIRFNKGDEREGNKLETYKIDETSTEINEQDKIFDQNYSEILKIEAPNGAHERYIKENYSTELNLVAKIFGYKEVFIEAMNRV